MKLWLIHQSQHTDYFNYDSAVVAAENAQQAVMIHPANGDVFGTGIAWSRKHNQWAHTPEQVSATYIGEAKEGTKQGVILASFNGAD